MLDGSTCISNPLGGGVLSRVSTSLFLSMIWGISYAKSIVNDNALSARLTA